MHSCDIIKCNFRLAAVNVVIADPPWYEDDALGFLRASSEICTDHGIVLVSFAPDGVRPGIEDERERIIDAAAGLGLTFVEVEALKLSYATPFFEYNALRAAGFERVVSDWRRGDLLTFRKVGDFTQRDASYNSEVSNWDEAEICGVHFWIRRRTERRFSEPCLKSVVEGDILPTVSRRDSRRDLADVWTSGNRVYGCEGTFVLGVILRAMRESLDPIALVEDVLRQRLSKTEMELVSFSVDQLKSLVRTERHEMRRFAYASPCCDPNGGVRQ